jgi:hypothetical protein
VCALNLAEIAARCIMVVALAGEAQMVWFVRAIVLGVCISIAPVMLAHNGQPLAMRVVSGLLGGLFIIWLASQIGGVGKRLQTSAPARAKRIGIVLYQVCVSIAALALGSGALLVYAGLPARTAAVSAGIAILYWAAGWGLRRAFTE